jgi:hypothetical protein
MTISSASDSDPCPVTDDKLGELYRASKDGLPRLIATVSPDVRAALALYCYRRAHLNEIGLAVASTCEERDLVVWGGTAGAALFARSREATSVVSLGSRATRQKITLATGALRKSLPIDDEHSDEPDDALSDEPSVDEPHNNEVSGSEASPGDIADDEPDGESGKDKSAAG